MITVMHPSAPLVKIAILPSEAKQLIVMHPRSHRQHQYRLLAISFATSIRFLASSIVSAGISNLTRHLAPFFNLK